MAAIKIQAQAALASGAKKDLQASLLIIVEATGATGKMVNLMLSSARAHALACESMQNFDLARMVGSATRSLAPSALDRGQDFA